MENRKAYIQGKLEEITNEVNNTFLTEERRFELKRDRILLEEELAHIAENEEQSNAKILRFQAQEIKREAYTLPTDFNQLFSSDNHLDAEGNPYIVDGANRIITQVVKEALIENDNEHNERNGQLETKIESIRNLFEEKRKECEEKDTLIETLRRQLTQTVIEKEDAEAKRDAAVEEKRQREAKESEDLAKMIADEKAEKERREAESKAKRTVYDLVPDSDINPKNYTAKLASTGETITFNWTQRNFYKVLTDENEVSQFRAEHSQASNLPDITLVGADIFEVTAPTFSDEQFRPSLGSVQESEEVRSENTGDADIRGHAEGVSGAAVTAAQLEQRLQQFAQEHGLVKQAVA